MANRRHGKSPVTAGGSDSVLPFTGISPGPCRSQLRFRLIHYWDAVNPRSGKMFGVELLIVDEQGTVMQGFIPSGRVQRYLPQLHRGKIYSLINFYGSTSKDIYRVADHSVTVTFSYETVLSTLDESQYHIDKDRFRFHSYAEFESNCGLQGDLYDALGHMKLVNGQALIHKPVLDEVEITNIRRITIHIQSREGPVMKLYLWDHAMREFCQKYKTYAEPPSVLLVTTVNTKRVGGTLGLNSMASSRVFMEKDIKPTIEYFEWLHSNPEIANRVNAEVVTKAELLTISELYTYMKEPTAKVAFFECIARIEDVVHGSPWFYIGCSGCTTKVTKGPTSLMCPKCGKVNVTGVAQYRAKIAVSDSTDRAVFVLLGESGRELIGKPASALLDSFYEDNTNKNEEEYVPVPQELVGTVGQTHKFCVKVTEYNLDGKSQNLTVTKVLSTAVLPPGTDSTEPTPATAMNDATKPAAEPCDKSTTSEVEVVDKNDAAEEGVQSKRPKI